TGPRPSCCGPRPAWGRVAGPCRSGRWHRRSPAWRAGHFPSCYGPYCCRVVWLLRLGNSPPSRPFSTLPLRGGSAARSPGDKRAPPPPTAAPLLGRTSAPPATVGSVALAGGGPPGGPIDAAPWPWPSARALGHATGLGRPGAPPPADPL